MIPTPPCFETAAGHHYSPFLVDEHWNVDPVAIETLSPLEKLVGKCMGKVARYFEFSDHDTQDWQEWLYRFGWDLPPVQSVHGDPIRMTAPRVDRQHGLGELATHAWSHALHSLKGEPTSSRDASFFDIALPRLADRVPEKTGRLPAHWRELLGNELFEKLVQAREAEQRDLRDSTILQHTKNKVKGKGIVQCH